MKILSARTTGSVPAESSIESDEVSRAALEMIRRYPADAIIRAEARYDALLARGKVDKALIWWRVKAAIARLHSGPSLLPQSENQRTV
jgi:hypothetical protein